MSATIEFLDDCKKRLGLSSTYALAKAWDMSEVVLGRYYKGDRTPDEFACFKIAETLGIDAAYVIAKIKSETEKDPKKAEYFKVFGGVLRKQAVNIMLVLVCVTSLLSAPDTGDDNVFVAAASSAATVLIHNISTSYNGLLRYIKQGLYNLFGYKQPEDNNQNG